MQKYIHPFEIDGILRDVSKTLSRVVWVIPEFSSDAPLSRIVYHIDEAVAAQASINLGMIIGIIVVILAIIILVLILYALRGRPQASTAISDNY
jgi:hypothetical protein